LPDQPDGSFEDRQMYALQLNQEGRTQEAMNLLSELLMERQDNFRIYLHLGELYFLSGDTRSAFAMLQKSIELNPLSAESFNDMGVVLNSLGDPNHARACFEQALRIFPDYCEARQNLNDLAQSVPTR
jgi:tetratricopeptide (TPR) repeat protein